MGSEDSEDDEMDDDYDSNDSFLVGDSESIQNTDDEEDILEQIAKSASKRRRSRILVESSTEDSNIESLIDASSNDVVSISVQVESVVVLGGSNAAEEKIVEGKKFATTYLLPENDEQQTETRTEKSAEKEVMKIKPIEQPETEENKRDVNGSLKDGETTDAPKIVSDKVVSDLTDEPDSTEAAITATATIPQNIDQSINANEVTENAPESLIPDSDVVASDSKDKEATKKKILTKKRKTSLSGIDPLTEASSNIGKKTNRMSLGDLNPNHQHLRSDIFDSKQLAKSKSISSKTKLIETEDNDSTIAPISAPEQIETDQRESSMNASTSSIENMSPNHSKASPSNISSQEEEENNNRKNSAKKCK